MGNKEFGDDLKPQYIYDKISDITPAALKAMGAKAVALDIDNTLAYDSTLRIFEDVPAWVGQIRQAGFGVVILSNTYYLRARRIAKQLGGLPYYYDANKPEKSGFLRAAARCGVKPGELAMIGDQLFTDIRGANGAGCISVLVRYRKREVLFAGHYRRLRKLEEAYLKKLDVGPSHETHKEESE
ncbi:MAG: YqeG family HAD IIIA-type phosphatase [Clostridia bacterium]|nr:YqeG family HAD IIIA-type phosphatase [Clostridia bacterium]